MSNWIQSRHTWSLVEHKGPFFFITLLIPDKHTVTCIRIARQRLGKDIPTQTKEGDNRISIARQRRGKHDSSTIQAFFCVVRAKLL
jgi:hypothetical protein